MGNRHGKLPWEDLFSSAIRVAEGGFEVTDLLYSKLVVKKKNVRNNKAHHLY
jgi:gamma-glutamyltranspeptidase/glutathione hydrolase/leukotriene-C4 hydrolase